MDATDLSHLDDRLEKIADQLRTQVREHIGQIAGLRGEMIGVTRQQDRLAKTSEEVGYLRGQMSLVCDELKALRRTVDDLLLQRASQSPRKEADSGPPIPRDTTGQAH
jgi:uncharacterized protein Yka (UPF0111/DUF47 family)